MRDTTARKLRRIARQVGADPKTSYGPAKLRGHRERAYALRNHIETSRTIMMRSCFRETYKTAKKIYLHKPLSAMVLHDVAPPGAWK